jgi:phage shock protein C
MDGDFMSSKKLYRAEEGKMLAGVCAGVAEYFDIDPSIVRLAWILFSLMGGSGLLAYIICIFVIPNKYNIQ